MNTILKIQNLGPISELQLTLKPITILTGESSSGKSILAKSIALLQSDATTQATTLSLEHYGLSPFVKNKETSIIYESEDKNTALKWGDSLIQRPPIFYSGNPKSNKNRRTVYMPIERSFVAMTSDASLKLLNSGMPIPSLLLDFAMLFNDAKNTISNLSLEGFDGGFKREQGDDNVYFNDEEYLSLLNSASTQQQLFPIFLVIHYLIKTSKAPLTFVIEEPVAGLSTKLKRFVWSYLLNIRKQYPNVAMIFTLQNPVSVSLLQGVAKDIEFSNDEISINYL